jgi:hypothetical protein
VRQSTEERELIARDVRPDSRKRVTLGERSKISMMRLSMSTALESVARGLDQIAGAKVIGSFAEYADDES